VRGLSRDFVRLVSVCCAISGCNGGGFAIPGEVEPILTARPGATTATGSTGKSEFLVAGSSAVIYVPPDVRADQPVGLALFLHGASRTVNFLCGRAHEDCRRSPRHHPCALCVGGHVGRHSRCLLQRHRSSQRRIGVGVPTLDHRSREDRNVGGSRMALRTRSPSDERMVTCLPVWPPTLPVFSSTSRRAASRPSSSVTATRTRFFRSSTPASRSCRV